VSQGSRAMHQLSGPAIDLRRLVSGCRWKAAQDEYRDDRESLTFSKLSSSTKSQKTADFTFAEACLKVNMDPLRHPFDDHRMLKLEHVRQTLKFDSCLNAMPPVPFHVVLHQIIDPPLLNPSDVALGLASGADDGLNQSIASLTWKPISRKRNLRSTLRCTVGKKFGCRSQR